MASMSNMIFRIKAKVFQENHFEKMNSSQYFIQSVYRLVFGQYGPYYMVYNIQFIVTSMVTILWSVRFRLYGVFYTV